MYSYSSSQIHLCKPTRSRLHSRCCSLMQIQNQMSKQMYSHLHSLSTAGTPNRSQTGLHLYLRLHLSMHLQIHWYLPQQTRLHLYSHLHSRFHSSMQMYLRLRLYLHSHLHSPGRLHLRLPMQMQTRLRLYLRFRSSSSTHSDPGSRLMHWTQKRSYSGFRHQRGSR